MQDPDEKPHLKLRIFILDTQGIMNSIHGIFIYLMVLILLACNAGLYSGASDKSPHQIYQDNQSSSSKTLEFEPAYSSRKLLRHEICTNRDISISQSRDSSSGIPQYIVQIVNTCMSGCAPSNVHVHCGWFASAKMVNPRAFKRLAYDDCLVNEARPLRSSQIIRFTYSNSFMYPLVFKSARFFC